MSYVRRDSSGSFTTSGVMHHQSKLDVFIIKAHRLVSNNAVINGEDVSVLNTASSSPRSGGPVNGSSPHNDLTLFQRLSQLYNATISTSLLDDTSTSPKSAIELYQRFQQIMKELELSYDVSPYGKYFRKLDNGMWQIKDDSELVSDQLWQLVSVSISTVYDSKTGQMLNQNRRRVNSMATSTKNSPSEVIDNTLPQQLQKRLQKLQQDSRQNFYSTSPASPSVVSNGNGIRSIHSNASSGREASMNSATAMNSGSAINTNGISGAAGVNNNMNNNMNTNMNANINSGVNPSMNSNVNSSMDPSMNSNINSSMNPNMNSNFNANMNPNFNTNMNPNMNSAMGSNMNTNMNPNMNSNMTPNMNSNMTPNMNTDMNADMNADIGTNLNPNLNNMNLALNMGLDALSGNPQGKRKYVGVGTPDQDAVDELLQLATKKAKTDLPTIEEDIPQPTVSMRTSNNAAASGVYERLIQEKDLRIKQLESDLEAQRQETHWLRKMLLEDLACVRSMLHKESRNRP
ncbi:LAME_0F16248g1_1 [Lachancea meyersii CBS 8951]|uniref:LAME_0F16248g1_1 n=1 Tax=Lachancea meyersii CBS 8951 TaxID=1266667 RepID=A0A1G4JZ14_9SACH|nr:LAME_0F16248g1_1 [Lachancea meyersii CBS 8951]